MLHIEPDYMTHSLLPVSDLQTSRVKLGALPTAVTGDAASNVNKDEVPYFVIKCGGSILSQLPDQFFLDLIELKTKLQAHPILVHGGGPEISELLENLSIEAEFVDGLRVTSVETVEVVEMVLSGKINKQLVRKVNHFGAKAVGISGSDGGLFNCSLLDSELGRVGDVKSVDPDLLIGLSKAGFIPVVSPVGVAQDGHALNINADQAAAAIAKSLSADICMASDIPGVYHQVDGEKQVAQVLDVDEINSLISSGRISGGMIPKAKSAMSALSKEVSSVTIFDGRQKGVLSKVLNHQPVGTRIVLSNKEDL